MIDIQNEISTGFVSSEQLDLQPVAEEPHRRSAGAAGVESNVALCRLFQRLVTSAFNVGRAGEVIRAILFVMNRQTEIIKINRLAGRVFLSAGQCTISGIRLSTVWRPYIVVSITVSSI